MLIPETCSHLDCISVELLRVFSERCFNPRIVAVFMAWCKSLEVGIGRFTQEGWLEGEYDHFIATAVELLMVSPFVWPGDAKPPGNSTRSQGGGQMKRSKCMGLTWCDQGNNGTWMCLKISSQASKMENGWISYQQILKSPIFWHRHMAFLETTPFQAW